MLPHPLNGSIPFSLGGPIFGMGLTKELRLPSLLELETGKRAHQPTIGSPPFTTTDSTRLPPVDSLFPKSENRFNCMSAGLPVRLPSITELSDFQCGRSRPLGVVRRLSDTNAVPLSRVLDCRRLSMSPSVSVLPVNVVAPPPSFPPRPIAKPRYRPIRCLTPEISASLTSSTTSVPENTAFPSRKRCLSETPSTAPRPRRPAKDRPRFQFALNLTPDKCSQMAKQTPTKTPAYSPPSHQKERPRSQSDSKPRRERREVTPPPISYAPAWRIPNHNVKIYNCETCGKKYKNVASLVKHCAEHERTASLSL
ncbi:hypothetical protein H4R33_003039 [Dimargaris cristalligena]|nr:hypothetical protein H4R33_003039 [Dimargaris cristalligena]